MIHSSQVSLAICCTFLNASGCVTGPLSPSLKRIQTHILSPPSDLLFLNPEATKPSDDAIAMSVKQVVAGSRGIFQSTSTMIVVKLKIVVEESTALLQGSHA
ncbi:hypothetical protein NE237_012670 [Protea cynaroides]|uniref:Uncharacterized protein n=1 Tax=Protea cynaroides TaxID=273540 RepID=A0A9Q0H1H9_9MAGN|nr:hypothetical protein NE237_012670 [Protea cynaroides]